MKGMDYKIRKFDQETGQIIVEVIGYFTIAIDLPIDESGRVPVGADLDLYIQGFIPVWEIERREKIIRGITNADEILALVEPADDGEAAMSADFARRERMALSAFELTRELVRGERLAKEEALGFVRDGILPDAYAAAITSLSDPDMAFKATFDLHANAFIFRLSPFAEALMKALKTEETAFDAVFTAAP